MSMEIAKERQRQLDLLSRMFPSDSPRFVILSFLRTYCKPGSPTISIWCLPFRRWPMEVASTLR